MRRFSVIGKYLWLLAFIAAGFLICKCTSKCCGSSESPDTLSVDSIVKHDTVYIVKHDTLPQEKGEKVIKYVKIPCYITDTVQAKDSIRMQIVQKTFSDDSTYTAYVCGIKYENLPKLDSITIRQRDIVNTVIKTITVQKKQSRWSVGIQGGLGYGFLYKGLEPYVGIGIAYTLPQ